jgi:hypothetical protein
MTEHSEQIELHPVLGTVELGEDRRPKIEEPPPVRIVAIEDCILWSPAGLERQLDEFYVGLLRFERDEMPPDRGVHEIVYRAENFRVRIEVLEKPLSREDFRPLTLVVESLADIGLRLTEAEVEFERQRGLMPGQDNLLLRDPAGNPVLIGEYRVAI